MALAAVVRAVIRLQNDATTYTASPTWTPAANSLLLAFCEWSKNDPQGTTNGVTGHGLTYTQVGSTFDYDGTANHIALFVADAGATPTSAAAEISFSTNRSGGSLIEIEVTGWDDTVGVVTDAIVGGVQTASGVGTSGSKTLAAASDANNRPMAFFVHDANELATEQTDWDELTDGSHTLPSVGSQVQWRPDTFDTAAAASWTSSVAWGVIGIELKAGAGGSGGTGGAWTFVGPHMGGGFAA